MPSRSAETLLVRRDGDDVLFLNKLRHRPDPALTLRIPLSQSDLPAARAALGKTGAFEGRDNRGVKVLAEILPVPGSPWFMVAKVDADEILAEARYRGQFILLFTALSMLVTGAMAAFVFSFRQKVLYQNLYRAEYQRRQVEEEIRATFYSIGDGVISTDAAGRVSRMNPVAEKLTGWSEAEALGKPSEAGLPHCQRRDPSRGREPGRARHPRWDSRKPRQPHAAYRSRRHRAPHRRQRGTGPGREGQITGAVLVFRDQTDERRAEMELRESQEQFRSIVSAVQDAIIMIDPQDRISSWNRSAERVFGYSAEEVVGRHLHRLLVPARLHESHEKGFAEFLRSGEGVAVGKVLELSALHKEGREFLVELSLAPVRLHDQWHAVGVVRDITERKRAEEKSKLDEARANTLLELSQMTDRSAAEIANHAMESAIKLTGSTIGYIAFANEDETVLTMHYWSNSAMQQCAMIDKPIVYPVKDTGLWGEAIRQRKAVITNDYAAPNPLKKGTPSGHVQLTRHMNIPVFDGGRIVAVAGVGNKADDYQDDDVRQLTLFMDGMWRILCRKRAEEALKQFNQQLESAAIQVKNLMNDVIHKRILTNRFENPSLSPCWEVKKCENTACPSYQNHRNLRCWEVAGTRCRGKAQGRFEQKLSDCSLCEVYRRARANPVMDLGETFNTMIAILNDRQEQLKETNQQLEAAIEQANEMAVQAEMGQPRQKRVPGQHEPRDPHAHDGHPGVHRYPSGRFDGNRCHCGRPDHQTKWRAIAAPDQRHPRHLED